MQLWNPRKNRVKRPVFEFTVGDDHKLDQNIFFPYDLRGSKAHAQMLAKQGILSKREHAAIRKGLAELLTLWEKGKVKISLQQEDSHTYIEEYLTKHFGSAGEKIHTWRSRNDQSLTMIRLYEIDQLKALRRLAEKLIAEWNAWAAKHKTLRMPGYTHMQRAMPTTVFVWQSSFADALADILPLLDATLHLLNQSPLGSGAGFGIPDVKLNRSFTAKALGFKRVQENPMYCQLSRGFFEAEAMQRALQIMTILSRWAADLLLFTTKEFGFMSLPVSFCTGSSIMPQKKNYDVLELLRAKWAVLHAARTEIDLLAAKLPSGYQRDLQLIKPPLARGLSIARACLEICIPTARALIVHPEKLKAALSSEIFAAEKVFERVRRGLSFRKAYAEVKTGLKNDPLLIRNAPAARGRVIKI